jgi:hypothetical protein
MDRRQTLKVAYLQYFWRRWPARGDAIELRPCLEGEVVFCFRFTGKAEDSMKPGRASSMLAQDMLVMASIPMVGGCCLLLGRVVHLKRRRLPRIAACGLIVLMACTVLSERYCVVVCRWPSGSKQTGTER